MIMICFFFRDSDTTAIYTYGNTISLQYALPIVVGLRVRRLLLPRHRARGYDARFVQQDHRDRQQQLRDHVRWRDYRGNDEDADDRVAAPFLELRDRKSTRLNSSH